MNIQHAFGKRTHESRAEQAHETRKAHQIHFMGVQFLNEQLVVGFALEPLGGNDAHRDAALARDVESRGVRAIADDDRDLGVQLAAGNVVCDGFEVRSAPGDQNAQAHFSDTPLWPCRGAAR